MSVLKQKLANVKHKAVFAVTPVAMLLAGAVPAFAVGEDTTFDLSTVMSTAVTKIVGDLLKMISVIFPTVITLVGAGIGIAYAIKFVKKIIH